MSPPSRVPRLAFIVLSTLADATLAGAAAGSALGYSLAPGGLSAAWRSGALGALIGVVWGVALALPALCVSARVEALRAAVLARGRVVAAASFGTAPALGAVWFVAMLVLPRVLPRIQVPQVSAFVALVLMLAIALGGAVIGALAGRIWLRRAPPESLRDAVALPVLAGGLATAVTGWLIDAALNLALDLAPGASGLVPPRTAMDIVAQSVDAVGALTVLFVPLLTPLHAAIARHSTAARVVGVILPAGLLLALSRVPASGPEAELPGPRRFALRALQRAFDRDGDGYSARFGGGDCNDRDPRVNPGREEVPGNGRDDDCIGGDVSSAAVAALDQPDPMTSEVRATMERAVRRDLNVVLLTVDALRADLHFAGNPLGVSPNLDRLAARSVVFTRAYATAGVTLRSMSSMLTGRYSAGLTRTLGGHPRFGRDNVFLVERLRAAGWRSACVPGIQLFIPSDSVSQGFDRVVPDALPERLWGGNVVDDRVATAMNRLVELPPEEANRYHLWAHFMDPHETYVPHPEMGDFGRPPAGVYWQEVAWTDRQIGRVLDTIDSLRAVRGDDTILIVTSDHGEALGEHGARAHGMDLWEVQMRVPLLMYVPGIAPRRVDTPRSHIDLVPTVLDLLRIPHPAPGAPDALDGRSLVPDLLGLRPPQRPIYADLPAEGWTNTEYNALIDGRWKIIQRGPTSSALYDLTADPAEEHDLATSRPAELARMRDLLSAFRARMRRVPPVAALPER